MSLETPMSLLLLALLSWLTPGRLDHFQFALIQGPNILGSGEGNGTPLQYSCLESPMDGGAW